MHAENCININVFCVDEFGSFVVDCCCVVVVLFLYTLIKMYLMMISSCLNQFERNHNLKCLSKLDK